MEIQFTGEILNYHIYTQIISILHVSKFESAISNVIKRFMCHLFQSFCTKSQFYHMSFDTDTFFVAGCMTIHLLDT